MFKAKSHRLFILSFIFCIFGFFPEGTPVSEIPITRNHKGKRVINVTTLKALGIKPRPNILINAELLKNE